MEVSRIIDRRICRFDHSSVVPTIFTESRSSRVGFKLYVSTGGGKLILHIRKMLNVASACLGIHQPNC